MVEHFAYNEEVGGSSPSLSKKEHVAQWLEY